jgi:hypothetical protein
MAEYVGGPKEAPNFKSVFRVGAATPLCVSVYHTCTYLSDCFSNNQYSEQSSGRFELFFPANFGSGLYLKNKLGKYVNYFKKADTELVLLTGNPKELKEALDAAEDLIIPNEDTKLCMFRVFSPSSWTLGQFIFASQQCKENPATLAWRLDERSFYAVKALDDIRIMLEFLSKENAVATTGSFYLKEHSLCGWQAF